MDPTALYDSLRHFADTWGLVFMFGIFLAVVAMLFLPGAGRRANDAANIPLRDDDDRANAKGLHK